MIAALRAGGVGSCWDLSTNSMSNHHLIPPHVCLLPHWVIEMLSQQHSYWILLCQTSHSLFCKKASAKACFLDLFPCWSFPLHLVLVAEPSAWTWWALCVVQQHWYPNRLSHSLSMSCYDYVVWRPCIVWQCLDLLGLLFLGLHQCLSINITNQTYFRNVLTLFFKFDYLYIVSFTGAAWDV